MNEHVAVELESTALFLSSTSEPLGDSLHVIAADGCRAPAVQGAVTEDASPCSGPVWRLAKREAGIQRAWVACSRSPVSRISVGA